jgi:hypothetical protein
MRIRLWWMAGAAILVAQGATDTSVAQQVVRSPDEIRTCLCQEQLLSTLNDDVRAQNRAYEDRRQAFEAFNRQVQISRQQVNTNDQVNIDAFKRLLDQRDQSVDSLVNGPMRSYANAVARYNQAVAGYNTACTGKAYDPDQLAELRRNLNCPKP